MNRGKKPSHSNAKLTSVFVVIVFRVVGPPEAGAEAEVGQLDVALSVDENVVGLDVAVDEAHLVDAVDGARQLGDVEPEEEVGLSYWLSFGAVLYIGRRLASMSWIMYFLPITKTLYIDN